MSWAAAITGGASLLGGILGNSASAKQAAKNRDFQERMSSTSHQREVADLRAAGLNPVLSGTGGTGASTPSGSTATQEDVVTPAIASALSVVRTMADSQKTLAEAITETHRPQLLQNQADQALATANSARETAKLTITQDEIAQADRDMKRAIAEDPKMISTLRDNFRLDNALKQQDYNIAAQELLRLQQAGQVDRSEFGKWMSYIDKFLSTIGQILPWTRGGSSARSYAGPRR